MALQGQGNNSKQKVSTNTRGFQFTNSTHAALVKSSMSFNYWNDMVSLQMNPMLPEDKQSDFRKFDYEQNIVSAITIDRCQTLADIIVEYIVPAVEKNEIVSYGIPVSTSSNSLITIATVKDSEGEVVPVIGMHRNLNPETKKPEQELYYQFNRTQVIEDYSSEAGTFSISQLIPNGMSELRLFAAMLYHAVRELGNAGVHAIRSVQRSFHDQVREALNISGNLGTGNNRGGSNIFSQGTSKQTDGGAEETQIPDAGALQGMMNMS